jgi:molybdate transport system ATP-binding protein
MLEVDLQRQQGDFRLAATFRSDALFTVVVGPSGSGKTSTLRAIAGLDRLASGRIVVAGEVLADVAATVHLPARERRIGLVTQESTLLPHLTAVRNVALAGREGDRRQRRATAERWLERVGADGFASRRPGELSGGQRQRVALARALAGQPQLLLLDEPFSALDGPARAELRRLVRTLVVDTSTPALLVTHDATEALTLADRLVVLEAGVVTQSGTPAEVAAHPRSRFAAELVGLNLLRGSADGTLVTLDGGGQLRTADPADGRVALVVHPRAVAVHRHRPDGSPRNVLTGEVVDLDVRGDHVRVRVDGPVPLVAEVTPAAVAELGLVAGGTVHLAVKATEVQVHPDLGPSAAGGSVPHG